MKTLLYRLVILAIALLLLVSAGAAASTGSDAGRQDKEESGSGAGDLPSRPDGGDEDGTPSAAGSCSSAAGASVGAEPGENGGSDEEQYYDPEDDGEYYDSDDDDDADDEFWYDSEDYDLEDYDEEEGSGGTTDEEFASDDDDDEAKEMYPAGYIESEEDKSNKFKLPKSGPKDEFGSDLGVPQVLYFDGSRKDVYDDAIKRRVEDARKYVEDVIMVEDRYAVVRKLCRNRHRLCALWAAGGECEANKPFMDEQCAPVCGTCDQLHIETRCPLDPDAVDALYPGDLDRLFERILSDPYYVETYQPMVLSRPSYPAGEGPTNTTYQLGVWLIQLENIATEEEALKMTQLGAAQGYKRSADVGEYNPGTSYFQR